MHVDKLIQFAYRYRLITRKSLLIPKLNKLLYETAYHHLPLVDEQCLFVTNIFRSVLKLHVNWIKGILTHVILCCDSSECKEAMLSINKTIIFFILSTLFQYTVFLGDFIRQLLNYCIQIISMFCEKVNLFFILYHSLCVMAGHFSH